MNRNAQRKKLIHNAVPTLFDVPNPPPRLTPQRPLPHRDNIEVQKKPRQDSVVKSPDELIKGTYLSNITLGPEYPPPPPPKCKGGVMCRVLVSGD